MVVRASGERGVAGMDGKSFDGVVLCLVDVFSWTDLVDHQVLLFFDKVMFFLHQS